MARFYSPSTGLAYLSNNQGAMPRDVVPVTSDLRDTLLTRIAQAQMVADQAITAEASA